MHLTLDEVEYGQWAFSEKVCPPPTGGGNVGFPDFFWGKILSWISRFFGQKSLFSHRFSDKIHTGA